MIVMVTGNDDVDDGGGGCNISNVIFLLNLIHHTFCVALIDYSLHFIKARACSLSIILYIPSLQHTEIIFCLFTIHKAVSLSFTSSPQMDQRSHSSSLPSDNRNRWHTKIQRFKLCVFTKTHHIISKE